MNMNPHSDSQVVSFNVNYSKNQIEVTFRTPSNIILSIFPPRPVTDIVWKEIYGINDEGTITLIKTIKGTHIPATQIPEQFIFEE